MYGLKYRVLGKHAGKNKILKVLSFFTRSLQLLFFALGKRFSLVFCHGTRGVFLPAKLLGIPLLVLFDYEYTALPGFMEQWITESMMPEVIPDDVMRERGIDLGRCTKYPGFKEELYIYDYPENHDLFKELGIPESKVIVLIRPPATMAHYHQKRSEQLFNEVLNYFLNKENVHLLLIPRTAKQRVELEKQLKEWSAVNVTIPDRVYFGAQLIRSADVIVSGGGTMNREAACLEVPVYSIYAGPLGGVDQYLIRSGKLRYISEAEQLKEIPLRKRPHQKTMGSY